MSIGSGIAIAAMWIAVAILGLSAPGEVTMMVAIMATMGTMCVVAVHT